jgi:hypothetical protein
MKDLEKLRQVLHEEEILKPEEQVKIRGGKCDDDKRRRRPGTTKNSYVKVD